jgi:DNA helicase HerA-like ATPase
MKIDANRRMSVFGVTQSGKTYFVKQIISSIPNVIIYDIKREYSQFGTVVRTPEGFKEAIRRGIKRIVIQPLDLSPEYFDRFCEIIFKTLKNIMLVVDEAHKYCTKSKITYWFNSLVTITQGKEFRIGIIAITQRPANMHNDMITQSTAIISFMVKGHDAKAVSRFTSIPIEALERLPQHYFYIYDEYNYNKRYYKHTPI